MLKENLVLSVPLFRGLKVRARVRACLRVCVCPFHSFFQSAPCNALLPLQPAGQISFAFRLSRSPFRVHHAHSYVRSSVRPVPFARVFVASRRICVASAPRRTCIQPTTLLEIILKLKSTLALPDTVLVRQGEYGDRM